MKKVTVKDLTLGEGTPKIIAPIMGANEFELLQEAETYKSADFDILEWRADYLENISDSSSVLSIGRKLREVFPSKPVLFTFRTAKEGGRQDISEIDYTSLNQSIINSGLIDLIDLELTTDEALLRPTIDLARSNSVKVVISSHDFHSTPPKEEIINRLTKMQRLGADITKIAVMPQRSNDVLTLLTASQEMKEAHADRPFITILMGKLGIVSRLSGGVFGSCATFGAVNSASAPGQIGTKELRAVLNILHG